MFKFVVLCAFLAAATAEPGAVFSSYPVGYSAAPTVTTYGTYGSPAVYQPAVVPYSSAYAYPHFIKKRSANLAYSSFVAPTTYVSSPYTAPFASAYTAPYVSAASVVPTVPFTYTSAAHLIKKRSTAAYVAPATYSYFAPTTYAATAPFVAPAYAGASLYSTPYVTGAPVYSPHFIKKRSAPFAVSSYAAPTAYSTQTRVDYSTPFAHSYVAAAPVTYASAYGAPLTHVY